MIAALELDHRLRRAGHAVAYLVVSLPVTLLAWPAVALLVIGAALSVAGHRAAARGRRGGCVPGARAAGPARREPLAGHAGAARTRVACAAATGALRRTLDLLNERSLWRMAAFLTIRPLLAAALMAVALVPVFVFALLLELGIEGVAGAAEVDFVGPWTLTPLLGVILLAFALPAAALTVATLETLYRVLCVITQAVLVPRTARSGPVRELLAESLGDRSITVAYWLPDREKFVDEQGRDVTLPRARLGPGVDRRGARRPAARGDHPRRRAGHEPGAGGSRRGVLRAGARQRAPARGPAGAAGGAAALARADHGGRRRRAAADRAQPARRRAAAARRARAGPADAQGAAARTRRSTSCPSGWRARWRSCASSRAASTPRSSPTAGSPRRSPRSPTGRPCRWRCRWSCRRSDCPRRSRRPRTSWSRRR